MNIAYVGSHDIDPTSQENFRLCFTHFHNVLLLHLSAYSWACGISCFMLQAQGMCLAPSPFSFHFNLNFVFFLLDIEIFSYRFLFISRPFGI